MWMGVTVRVKTEKKDTWISNVTDTYIRELIPFVWFGVHVQRI